MSYISNREIYDHHKDVVEPVKAKLDSIDAKEALELPVELKVEYDYPDYGWLPTTFEAGANKLEIEFSDVYYSLEELGDWFKAIVSGDYNKSGVQTITDDEDVFHLFSFRSLSSDKSSKGVFYLLEYYYNHKKNCICIEHITALLTPKEVVRMIYLPLLEKFHSMEKVPVAYRHHGWLWYPHDDEEESWQDVIETFSSKEIDDFIKD